MRPTENELLAGDEGGHDSSQKNFYDLVDVPLDMAAGFSAASLLAPANLFAWGSGMYRPHIISVLLTA